MSFTEIGSEAAQGRRGANVRISPAREVVADALRRSGPLTRRELGEVTSLSRPTVSAAVRELMAAGVLEEIHTDSSATGPGRPSGLLRINSLLIDTVGIEIGRAHVAVAVADAAGSIVGTAERPLPATVPLIERAQESLSLFEELSRGIGAVTGAITKVGVGTPGPRFRDGGREASDLSLALQSRLRAEVVELMSERFATPIVIENNTKLTALAEAESRGEHAGRDLIYLRVDEGIGGGVVVDGRLATGSWGVAGELGHVSTDPTGPACPCGGRGCLELFASMHALTSRVNAPDAAAFIDAVHRGAHREQVADAAIKVGGVIASALSILNPQTVVVGGSVGSLPGFLQEVESTAVRVAPTWATIGLLFEPARADHLGGAIGATMLAAARTRPARPSSGSNRRTRRAGPH